MRRARRTMPEVRLEMTPLIDVVFLLLTFFIFAMLMMVRAQVLDVTLPTFGSGQPAQESAAITVTIDAAGEVYVDAEVVGTDGLIDAVRSKLDEKPEAKLNIAADTACPSGDLLGVIDLLSKNGFGAFQLFGTPEDGAGTIPANQPAPEQ
jgi:biopolymer transport protein ExbD